jgi:hypothetical protein
VLHIPAVEALGIMQFAKLGSGRRGIVMTKTAMLVIVLGIAVGFVLWSFAPEIKGAVEQARNISIQELHAVSNHEALPAQEFEDQSLVFSKQDEVKK